MYSKKKGLTLAGIELESRVNGANLSAIRAFSNSEICVDMFSGKAS